MAPKYYEEDKSPEGMNGTLQRENQESSYGGREKLEKKSLRKYFFDLEKERDVRHLDERETRNAKTMKLLMGNSGNETGRM